MKIPKIEIAASLQHGRKGTEVRYQYEGSSAPVLADVHAELVAGTKRMSLDVWPIIPETGQPDEKAFVGVPWAGIRIMSAMLAEPSSWPWPEGASDVRP